jgi:cytoskeletal protein RodZ
MKTIGNMLREKRIELNKTLEDIEKDIKIRKKFLSSIESDDYMSLPSRVYAEGFVRRYGKYLGFSEREITAFFHRQMSEPSKASILPKKSDTTLEENKLRLTPTKFLAILLSIFLLFFAGYFLYQYRTLQFPPKLEISSPKENFETIESRVEVIGSTDSDATVSVQGVSVLVRDDGKFFDQVTLEKDETMITIIATSRYGKSTTVTRTVKRNHSE